MGLKNTDVLEEPRLKQWDATSSQMKNVTFWQYDQVTDKMIAVPFNQYVDGEMEVLNQGTYATTWTADWGQSYRYLNLRESASNHGTKYVRQETSKYKRGEEFLFQGWWSQDPNGNAASLFGFDADSLKKTLSGANILKVELYMRNIHAYNTSADVRNKVIPNLTAYLWEHNTKSKPSSIKKSTYFGTGNTSEAKFIRQATYWRGASVQRVDSPYTYADWNTKPNFTAGKFTGLFNWDLNPDSSFIDGGSGSGRLSWIELPTKYGEKMRDGQMCGFGLFKNSANDEGEGYGYWGSPTITIDKYLAINSGNRAAGFNKDVTWRPMLRITYTKLNVA